MSFQNSQESLWPVRQQCMLASMQCIVNSLSSRVGATGKFQKYTKGALLLSTEQRSRASELQLNVAELLLNRKANESSSCEYRGRAAQLPPPLSVIVSPMCTVHSWKPPHCLAYASLCTMCVRLVKHCVHWIDADAGLCIVACLLFVFNTAYIQETFHSTAQPLDKACACF